METKKSKGSWGGKRENSGRKGFGFEVKAITLSVRVKHHEEFKRKVKELIIKLYEND